jgi:hypothetical protein
MGRFIKKGNSSTEKNTHFCHFGRFLPIFGRFKEKQKNIIKKQIFYSKKQRISSKNSKNPTGNDKEIQEKHYKIQ